MRELLGDHLAASPYQGVGLLCCLAALEDANANAKCDWNIPEGVASHVLVYSRGFECEWGQ